MSRRYAPGAGREVSALSSSFQELQHLQGLARVESDVEHLSEASLEVWTFADPEDVWLHNQLARLERTISMYEDPKTCLLYTSPSPRDVEESRMPSSA